MKFETKKDKYRKSRGGYSRFLDICCSVCGQHIAYYQKDGFGSLKRMYLDRFVDRVDAPGLVCPSCGAKIGSRYTYAPEDRPAYLLHKGSFSKKIVKD